MARQVIRAQPDQKVRWEQTDLRVLLEIQDLQDPKDHEAFMVMQQIRVQRDLKVPRAKLDLKVRRVTWGRLVRRDRKVLKVKLVFRARWESKDHLGRWDKKVPRAQLAPPPIRVLRDRQVRQAQQC